MVFAKTFEESQSQQVAFTLIDRHGQVVVERITEGMAN